MAEICGYEVSIEKYTRWLVRDRGLSHLTARNYASQLNKFVNEHSGSLKELPEYLYKRPVSARKGAFVQLAEYIKEIHGNEPEELTGILSNVNVRSFKRRHHQTLDYERTVKLVKMLLKEEDRTLREIAGVCMIICDTGARVRAILKLRKRHIEVKKDGSAYLWFEEKGKKSIRRRITKETLAQLESIFSLESLGNDDYLFFNGSSIRSEWIDELYSLYWSNLKNYTRKHLKEGISFHWIRRGAGVRIYELSGNDIIVAQEFLGHNSVRTTQIYLMMQAKRADDILKNETRPW